MAVFLDSALENGLGRYSIIGLDPYLILKEEDGVFYENGVPQNCTFEEGMAAVLRRDHEENPTDLPLTAWLPSAIFPMTTAENSSISPPGTRKRSPCPRPCSPSTTF